MARPRKKIEPETVEKLAALNCSVEEMGLILGCDRRTLQRRFAAAIEKGRAVGKMSLKRKMWDTAMHGNVTMMIWLSKQMLGYTDKNVELTAQLPKPTIIECLDGKAVILGTEADAEKLK